jgi:hypothetical protein
MCTRRRLHDRIRAMEHGGPSTMCDRTARLEGWTVRSGRSAAPAGDLGWLHCEMGQGDGGTTRPLCPTLLGKSSGPGAGPGSGDPTSTDAVMLSVSTVQFLE